MSSSSLPTNLSFAALPLGWVSAIAPHWFAAYLTTHSKELKMFDNRSPRQFNARIMNSDKPGPDAKKYLRAEAAQQNGFENYSLFVATVAIGNVARLPSSLMNKFVGFWLASRTVYNLLYIQGTSNGAAGARSVTYVAGVVSCFYVMIQAGKAWNAAGALVL